MTRRWIVLLSLPLAAPAVAHHSFAPHFDRERQVVLEGTIVRFEARNPHAYLHVEVADGQGGSAVWKCESHGVTMLERNGVRRDLLTAGTQVRVEGSPAWRDPHGCFFRLIELADGTRLSADGPAPGGAPAAARVASAAAVPDTAASAGPVRAAETVAPLTPATAARSDLFGTWLMRPRPGGGGGVPDPMSNYFTEAGRAASASYDPFTDDPVLRCDTIGIRRVWFAVATPLEIRREGDRIRIRHEWMDAERIVHLDQQAFPEPLQAGTLGYSIGRFEDDGALVIDTRYARGGVLSQYVALEDGSQIGLLHTDALETRERVFFDADTGLLNVTIETHDPVYYTRPFPPVSTVYAPTDLEVQPFGCVPEVED